MSLLIALIIGLGMGAGTGYIFRRNGDYIVTDLIAGVSGSILSMAIYFLAQPDQLFGLFNWGAVIIEVLGAALVLMIYQLFLRIPKKKKKSTV